MTLRLRPLRVALFGLAAFLFIAPAVVAQEKPAVGRERTQFGTDITVSPEEQIGDVTCFGCSVRVRQKQKDPDHFPDLSLAVVKLMGPGEYVLVKPNEVSPGHFGLAVQDYTHSTAPNRRFPDVVTQRLLKAHLANAAGPYSEGDLNAIAQRCTQMEDAARKVERDMQKRIAAVVLHPRIGQSFRAIVTGVNQYGTFVRALDPHVEGMLVNAGKPGTKGFDVGDKLTVKLVSTDPQRGFIDFAV